MTRREDVPVGGWYAVDYCVYQRTDAEPCPSGDHPMCHDLFVCEVDDVAFTPEDAQRIAALHNAAEDSP